LPKGGDEIICLNSFERRNVKATLNGGKGNKDLEKANSRFQANLFPCVHEERKPLKKKRLPARTKAYGRGDKRKGPRWGAQGGAKKILSNGGEGTFFTARRSTKVGFMKNTITPEWIQKEKGTKNGSRPPARERRGRVFISRNKKKGGEEKVSKRPQ